MGKPELKVRASRFIKYALGSGLALAVVLTLGFYWLLWTTPGTEWLLASVSYWTPLNISAERVAGTMAKDLRLEELHVGWPGGDVEVRQLRLRWRLTDLFGGRLAVEDLTVSGIDVRLPAREEEAAAAEAFRFRWPHIPVPALRLTAEIKRLEVNDLILHPNSADPVAIHRIRAGLVWEDGIFSVSGLEVASGLGDGKMDLRLGLVAPELELKVEAALAEPRAGLNRFVLRGELSEADSAGTASGTLLFEALAGKELRYRLDAALALRQNRLRITSLAVTQPGRPGRIDVRADLTLETDPRLNLEANIAGLNLLEEIGVDTQLNGRVQIDGRLSDYRGDFSLANRVSGWQNTALAGLVAGNRKGIRLTELRGNWLKGEVEGDVRLGWADGLEAHGLLSCHRLNPEILSRNWPGEINLELDAGVQIPATRPFSAKLKARLLDSRLHHKALTGLVNAHIDGERLTVKQLQVQGDGFVLAASGPLHERLSITADIRNLAGLVPKSRGRLSLTGWLRWQNAYLSGELDGAVRALAVQGLQIEKLDLALRHRRKGRPISVEINGQSLQFQDYRLDSLDLDLSGDLARHQGRLDLRWADGEARLEANGGYRQGCWSGKVIQLGGEDRRFGIWALENPVDVVIATERLMVEKLVLVSRRGERFDAAADVTLRPLRGQVTASAARLDLARANAWLTPMAARGSASATAAIRWLEAGRMELAGSIDLSAILTQEEDRLEINRAQTDILWNEKGLIAGLDIALTDGGKVNARVESAEPGRLNIPEEGAFRLSWEAIDLVRARPLMPPGLILEGHLAGQARGRWLGGRRLEMTGRAGIGEGRLEWSKGKEGNVSAALRQAELNWIWQDRSLQGDVTLALADYGRMEGAFRLPLPARLPAIINPEGNLKARLAGRLEEKGLLAVLLPGVVRESRGELDFDLTAGGTLKSPRFGGRLMLTDAGGYFPAAGIQLQEVGVEAEFTGDRLRIEHFQLRSGPGSLKGDGEVLLDNWRLSSYRAAVKGDRFQLINLPELRMQIRPDLQVEGDLRRLKVRGEVVLPEVLISGKQKRTPVEQSPDVIIVDATESKTRPWPLELDLRLRLELGDQVLVRLAGIDARLAGDLQLAATSPADVTAQGEINVVKGDYSAYGIKLNITRGRILFAGGPLDRPTLDVLALRTRGNVRAGVHVSGTPRAPVVKLYSEPGMPDTDVLSYIVLGHPIGADSGQTTMLMAAAGALLSKGESTVLKNRLQRSLGVDVIDIQAGDGNVESSVVTIGKYLTPELYLSISRGLLNNAQEFRMRYSLNEYWEMETNVGIESGADLFYKIEFQ